MRGIWRRLLPALALLIAGPAAAQTHGALLVVTKQSHALAIVDADTLAVLATVPIGEDPHEVTVGPDGRTAFVSNYGEGTLHTLARVDLVARQPLPPVDVGALRGPHGMHLLGDQLWFTVEGSKALARLDVPSGRVVEMLGTGQDKTHLVWVAPDGKRILASNAISATFSIFDRVTVTPVSVPGSPPKPAAYTVPGWRHTIVPVGPAAEGFAVSPGARQAWVGNNDGTISIVDVEERRVVETLSTGTNGANRLAFTPDGRFLLVTMRTGKDLVVIDAATRAVAHRIPIEERGASGIQIAPDGKRAFIACPRDHYVAVVDLEKMELVAKVDAGREPDGLAWWTPR